MKVMRVNNSQMLNNKKEPAFGRFKILDGPDGHKIPGGPDGYKILSVIEEHFPVFSFRRINSGFTFTTKRDLEIETGHFRLMETDKLCDRYNLFLDEMAPVVSLADVEKLSKKDLGNWVTTTYSKFVAFVEKNNVHLI